ncbi:hypothetical protein SCLCIDRAFT_954435 [Scleroderma citrinum Foug A]|uniref:Uncharacterized protein n=1 Tax=Scleroderma citrinum Foug A TaxID=1036808 RepID=A0A0C3AU35_9AGAM|nr:hypothetical protein SCLCIDRAFT_954435 [Scleroderma citrinum Foug A]
MDLHLRIACRWQDTYLKTSTGGVKTLLLTSQKNEGSIISTYMCTLNAMEMRPGETTDDHRLPCMQ